MDGILIANEVMDEARRLKKDMLLFKVDFEKAYDSVDFRYLDSVMIQMNFPTLWRKWIFECVGSACFSFGEWESNNRISFRKGVSARRPSFTLSLLVSSIRF